MSPTARWPNYIVSPQSRCTRPAGSKSGGGRSLPMYQRVACQSCDNNVLTLPFPHRRTHSYTFTLSRLKHGIPASSQYAFPFSSQTTQCAGATPPGLRPADVRGRRVRCRAEGDRYLHGCGVPELRQASGETQLLLRVQGDGLLWGQLSAERLAGTQGGVQEDQIVWGCVV